MKLTLKIKPSALGQYFERQCDKFLIYNAINTNECVRLGWNPADKTKMKLLSIVGNQWEKKVIEELKGDEKCHLVNLKASDKKDKNDNSKKDNQHDKPGSVIETLRNLRNTDKPTYIYQGRLLPTDSFLKEYCTPPNCDGTKLTISDTMLPDIIMAEYSPSRDKFRLTVIDMKSYGILKISAMIQIALYVRVLKYVIEDEKITNCFVNEEEGIVWNREKITENRIERVFSLTEANDQLDIFFGSKAPELISIIDSCQDGEEIQQKLDYCMTQQCEYCGNYEKCKEISKEKQNIHLMPYITAQAQARVKELVDSKKLEDDSLRSVMACLQKEPIELVNDCHYWGNVKNNLLAYVSGMRALFYGRAERYSKEASSLSLPVGQDFAFFITAQQDAISGRVYAFSWLLAPGKGIDIWNQGLNENSYVSLYERKEECPGKGTYYDTVIAESDSSEEFDRIECVFVEKIYTLLEKISNYPDKKKRKLQCYVMDDYEKNNIENTLFSMLERLDPDNDQALLEKTIAILFWLQGERLITESRYQPEECVDNPITVLTTEISRLYVLSSGIAYNLKAVASIFSPNFNFDDGNDLFFGNLTNTVKSELIVLAWKSNDLKNVKKLVVSMGYHLRKRLFVERSILSAIQKDNNQNIHLSAWPMQYKMQKPKYPEYPDIARLDFQNRYEQLLTYHGIRSVRISGIDNAIDGGQILWIEYTGSGNTYTILNRENYIGREWFSAWLCEDTPENRNQVMLLSDKDYTANNKRKFSEKFNARGTDTVFYPVDFEQEYNFSDNGTTATVDFLPKEKANFVPKKGKKYLFFEIYSDMNSDKTSECIGKLVYRQELLDPRMLSGETGIKWNDETKRVCSKYWSPDGHGFSDSQMKAFIHLLENKLNVLQGPPASGKTDFISRALITAASYYKEKKGKNLKVMVTANSHSAIENVLLKLDKMLKKRNPCDIHLYKASRYDDPKAFIGSSVHLLQDKSVANNMINGEIQIIGMTCWSAYKEFHHPKTGRMREFDMIVVDEASQLRAMDSFIALECSDRNTQFLLVGDDDQLPPIIAGNYKEKEGEKYIHGSIFKMYTTGLMEGHPDLIRLTDNFRMNSILCRYPAEKLYGPEYRAFNDEIGSQKILRLNLSVNDFVDSVLDPEYPLVFCELSGIARQQNKAEVELVTRLIHYLWSSLGNFETGNPASKDGNFWRDHKGFGGTELEGACGIISPHHEHISRLRTSISKDLGISRNEVYVGTVDKLQGKERKVVIVSYGVSESEKISNEAEFIYSSNRFNVSMTRGKAKTIVFLSDAIAEPTMETTALTANNDTLKKGVEYIHGYVKYMKEEQEGEELIEEEYPLIYEDISLKVWKKRMGD